MLLMLGLSIKEGGPQISIKPKTDFIGPFLRYKLNVFIVESFIWGRI